MAFTLVNSLAYTGGTNGGTSGGVDMTGANLLVAFVIRYRNETVTLSDSQTNTWTGLTEQLTSTEMAVRWYYVLNPSVGASQTFTLAGTNIYSSVHVLGFSGAAASSAFDQQNGAVNESSASTIATGSVTPTEDNELLVYGASLNLVDVTGVDVGTLATHFAGSGGNYYGSGTGYQIQTTATARNPVFTGASATSFQAAAIATFKAAAGGGSSIVPILNTRRFFGA